MKSLTPAAIAAVLFLGALHGSPAGAATLGTSALVSPAIVATGENAEDSNDPVLQVLDFIFLTDTDIDSADVSSADTSTDSGE